MEAEAKYDQSDPKYLLKAAEAKDWAAVEALAKVHAEAAVEVDPDIKWTAMHWAAAEKAPVACVKALLEAFPDALYMKDIDKQTPSDLANANGNEEATALFAAAEAAAAAAAAAAEAEAEAEGEGSSSDEDDEGDEDTGLPAAPPVVRRGGCWRRV